MPFVREDMRDNMPASEHGKYILGSHAHSLVSLRLNKEDIYNNNGTDNNMSIPLNSGVGTENVKKIKVPIPI